MKPTYKDGTSYTSSKLTRRRPPGSVGLDRCADALASSSAWLPRSEARIKPGIPASNTPSLPVAGFPTLPSGRPPFLPPVRICRREEAQRLYILTTSSSGITFWQCGHVFGSILIQLSITQRLIQLSSNGLIQLSSRPGNTSASAFVLQVCRTPERYHLREGYQLCEAWKSCTANR